MNMLLTMWRSYTQVVDKYVTKNMDQSGDKWREMDNG